MLEAFLGWLLGVVYNDSLGVVLGDILGDSWWFYE